MRAGEFRSGQRPPLEDNFGIGRIHAVAARIRVPGDEVTPRHAPHDLVRTGHDAGERGPRSLPVASRQRSIEHQSLIAGGPIGDFTQQPAAVHSADRMQHLTKLPATEVCLVSLVRRETPGMVLRTHHPSPRKCQQLILGVGLELDPRHLKTLVLTCHNSLTEYHEWFRVTLRATAARLLSD
jgi:hypothetical protein